MKSIRSELSSLWSVDASRAWSRGRLRLLVVVEGLAESMLALETGTGPAVLRITLGAVVEWGTWAAALPLGPVDRMNSAKSASDSRGILASLACGGFTRVDVRTSDNPPLVREIDPDLFTSLGLTSEEERERSPFPRASSLLRTLTEMTGLPVVRDRVDADCDGRENVSRLEFEKCEKDTYVNISHALRCQRVLDGLIALDELLEISSHIPPREGIIFRGPHGFDFVARCGG